jgi:pyruvate/2-oxoglutarate dehydrogenase complex dihydrolipoamide dehydrogenase (E3) component
VPGYRISQRPRDWRTRPARHHLRNMKGCPVFQGSAQFEGPKEVRVGTELLSAALIFINVGGRAIVPDLPGVNEIPYLTNSSMLELERVPEHLWSSAAAMSASSSPRCIGALAPR